MTFRLTARTSRPLPTLCLLVLLAGLLSCSNQPPATFDLVILGGRVMDPESGFDQIANLAVKDGKIAALSSEAVRGRETIDASGLIVAPGFIDLHSHGQDDENYRFKAMDGVTVALELEVGVADIDSWYAAREGRSLIHFGASVGHISARMRVMRDQGSFLPSGPAADRAATEDEIASMMSIIRKGLERGAPGVGLGVQYTPAASRSEIKAAFEAASEFSAPCFVHMRYMGSKEGESAPVALDELLEASRATGAPLHVVHIQSSGLGTTKELLAKIAAAQADGLAVTTEVYPYTAAMTELESAIFQKGWRQLLGIDYGDLLWVKTGERLTEKTFPKYRKEGGLVVMFMISQEAMEAAIVTPGVMIASDGLLQDGKGHPRGAGAFARVLGRFVREDGKLALMEAIGKMTIEPAKRLRQRTPMMANKGRIRIGADADITIFDPETVIDRATFDQPALYSQGIEYVLVGGFPVVRQGKLDTSRQPGEPIRAAIRRE